MLPYFIQFVYTTSRNRLLEAMSRRAIGVALARGAEYEGRRNSERYAGAAQVCPRAAISTTRRLTASASGAIKIVTPNRPRPRRGVPTQTGAESQQGTGHMFRYTF